jgi:hypothetical protein
LRDLFRSFILTKSNIPITENDDDNQQNDTMTTITFCPSKWLLKLGLGYEVNASLSSMMGWFETHRIIARDSPIFESCYEGNLEDVQKLLSNGQASIWEIDEYGQTM